MRLWRVILLVNLALGLGLFLGYLAWGRDVARLGQQLEQARRQQSVAGAPRTWQARGVVRAVLPELNVVVLTHEDLAGYMGSMTMGFRVHDPKLYAGLDIGDAVRFTLTGAPPNVEITAIAKESP
jgi:Cu/Ag efflux protein CusF